MVYIDFVVQPPSEVRPGDTLYPPPIVKLSNAQGDLWAYATLLNDCGQIVQDSLAGTTLDSAQPLPTVEHIPNYPRPEQEDSYVAFPNLTIHSEGDFKIRITLMSNSRVGTSSLEEVDSRTITVQDGTPGNVDLGMLQMCPTKENTDLCVQI